MHIFDTSPIPELSHFSHPVLAQSHTYQPFMLSPSTHTPASHGGYPVPAGCWSSGDTSMKVPVPHQHLGMIYWLCARKYFLALIHQWPATECAFSCQTELDDWAVSCSQKVKDTFLNHLGGGANIFQWCCGDQKTGTLKMVTLQRKKIIKSKSIPQVYSLILCYLTRT